MSRLRLLLCDDEPQILSWLQSVLEPEHTVVGTVQNGRALLDAAQALRPDLIVTEIDIPVLNGLDIAQALRTALPHCRVIFHTSRSEPEMMAAAFAAGAAGYLIKGGAPSLSESIRMVIDQVGNQHGGLVIERNAHRMF